ncbi:hypothetical protein C8J56DRAFT_981857 [Mycena floridula]|nr:hypothetical protein C8J56DRAFT_981857 [Mycena floridula]
MMNPTMLQLSWGTFFQKVSGSVFQFTSGSVFRLTSGALLLWIVLVSVNRYIRHRLFLKTTCVNDLTLVNHGRSERLPGTVVICGGSIAGLLTAVVCQNHFEKVIIHVRSRIPQYYSQQAFQAFGFDALCALFPGFEDECSASGIPVSDSDFKVHYWGNPRPAPYNKYLKMNKPFPKTIFASRGALETLIRRLVLAKDRFPRIRQIIGTVAGVGANKKRLDKVLVRAGEATIGLEADFVIDCTGPSRGGLKWIQRQGFGTVDSSSSRLALNQLQLQYNPHIRYHTFYFRVTPEVAKRLPIPGGFEKCPGTIFNCVPDARYESKVVYCQKVDGDLIQLAPGQWGPYTLPENLDEVKEHVRAMVVEKPIPEWFFELLDELDSVNMTSTKVLVKPASWVQYELAADLPSNFVAIGDSVMQVNPVFGQGCVKAIMGAITLNTLLCTVPSGALPEGFSDKFFAMQSAKIRPIWDVTRIGDYGWSTTVPMEGETLATSWLVRWYGRHLFDVAFKDQEVAGNMWHVDMFLRPPIDNLKFTTIMKVLWHAIKSSMI